MSHARARLSYLKQCLLKFSSKCCLNLESTQPRKHHIMNLTRLNSRSQSYFKGEPHLPVTFAKNQFRTTILTYTKPSATFSQKALPLASTTNLIIHRSYSLSPSNSTDISDWADELPPYVQDLLDSQALLVTSAGSTLIAWILMPLILRKLHQYSMQSPTAATLAHEKTFWCALEDPMRYLVTYVALLSHICVMEAPTNEALKILEESWRKVAIFLFTWFLYRWKTNVLEHMWSGQSFIGQGQQHELLENISSGQSSIGQGQQHKLLENISSGGQSFIGQGQQHKLLNLKNLSSSAVFGIGGTMALTEAGDVTLESVIFVGGIGGAAIAFAARDVLGDVFSGLYMQFSEPFTIGDTIKVGSVEGEVMEIGMTKTTLVNGKKKKLVVPNSYFWRQVIVIKCRIERHGMKCKIPMRIEAIHRSDKISDEIKRMFTRNANVCMEKEVPYCSLSCNKTSHAKWTLRYNLKLMIYVCGTQSKDEMRLAEKDIQDEVVKILKRHDAYLSFPSHDSDLTNA